MNDWPSTALGIGLVGVCPECTLANVRVDATFVTRTEGPAIGALWAADHGFEVINGNRSVRAVQQDLRARLEKALGAQLIAQTATPNGLVAS